MATVARTPDAELLRRLRARDRTAWEVLYLEHQPRLRAFAYSLAGNVHDADDLVQETFVRAVPRLDQLDPETTDVSAYLFTTLKNLFLKQVERRKRQEPMADVPEPAVPQPIEDDPQRSLLLRSQQEEVRVANARLQPRQRLVLALRELEDKSYAEIGEMVGMKENAVAQLIFRAREGLRTELRLVQVDPARLPEECRRFLPFLAAHLDGQLKGKRLDETLEHLEGCERCQAALADMQEASRRYRTLFLVPLGDEDARAAIDERLDASGYWATTPTRRRAHRARNAGALVAVALVLGGGGGALAVALTHDDVAEAEAVATTTAGPGSTTIVGNPVTKPAKQPAAATSGPGKTSAATTAATSTVTTAPPVTSTTLPATEPTAPAVTPKPKSKPLPTPTTERQTVVEPKAVVEPAPVPDTKAPIVTITSAPPAAAATDSAQVAFKANETGVTFSCSLDAAAATACTSPVALTGLSPGQHTFSVRGTDKAKNAGKPVSVSWTYTPARYDAADRDDLLGAAGDDNRRLRDLPVRLERAGIVVRLLTRRRRVRRLHECCLLHLSRCRLTRLLGDCNRCGRQHEPGGHPQLDDRHAAPRSARRLVHQEHDHDHEPRHRLGRPVNPDDHPDRDVHRPEARSRPLADVLVVDLPRRHLLGDRRPDERRGRVRRDEQSREPRQYLSVGAAGHRVLVGPGVRLSVREDARDPNQRHSRLGQ